jgi:hopene-associated glycosyltransferase HpnB
MLLLAALPVVIWLYLLLGRGMFWQIGRHLAVPSRNAIPAGRSVAVVIPARNEADVIGNTVASLLRQTYSGPLRIFVVDDASTDGTAEAAWRAAQADLHRSGSLRVIQSWPLPAGWTGKMWAVSQGVEEALKTHPDYLLLTDADIDHDPENLSALVAQAEAGSYDLVSFMVKLQNRSAAEQLLIPAFVFFFFLLYPPVFIRQQSRRIAGAAGGCMLVNPQRLMEAGGIEAIRGEIIDDCALASLIKRAGGRVWLGLTRSTSSTRSYASFGQIEHMISRTAFNQLQHSAVLLLGTLLGLAVVYLLPVALLFSGVPSYFFLGAAAWALMTVAYLPMVRFYGQNAAWSFLLPAAAVFYGIATFHSALQFWSGKGGQWKGRAQDSGVPSKKQP